MHGPLHASPGLDPSSLPLGPTAGKLPPAHEGAVVVQRLHDSHKIEPAIEAAASGQPLVAETQGAILDALSANVVLVNQESVILATNKAWRRFSYDNLMQSARQGIGLNYLDICDRASDQGSEDAGKAASGLRRVLGGALREFSMEYPCHSPEANRWCKMIVTPLDDERNTGAVIQHLDITHRIEAIKIRRDRTRLEQSLALAMHVQQSLLPANDPVVPGLDVAGRSEYCDATGGDYYDFIDVSDPSRSRLLIAVGDVSGHGIAAALLMASARAVVHVQSKLADDLPALMKSINTVLSNDTRHGRFMTMLLAVVDPRAGTLRWASAGHDAPFVYHPASDTFENLNQSDLLLGIDPNAEYGVYSCTGLVAGDLILIGTDGIWEVRGPDGKQFGKENLRRFIRENHRLGALDMTDALEVHLTRYLGGRPAQDDVTHVVIKIVAT